MAKKKEDGLFSIEKRQILISDDVAFVEHLVSFADLFEKDMGYDRFPLDQFREEFGKGLTDGDIHAMMAMLGIPITKVETFTRGLVPMIEYAALRTWLTDRKGGSHE